MDKNYFTAVKTFTQSKYGTTEAVPYFDLFKTLFRSSEGALGNRMHFFSKPSDDFQILHFVI